jgi:hypothetical protein
MSQDTKFIQEYKEKFNIDVLYIVNILNKIFNVPKNIKNYIEVTDNIPIPLHKDLTYENLKPNPIELEKEMFDRVCQNIASIYASPINNPQKFINLNDLPLTNDNTASKPVGITVGDLTEYVYDKETKKIIKKEKKGVHEKICNTDELTDLKKYFFLKLKLLVYLRSILNLNNDETTTNQWEKIFLDAVKSNYNTDKIKEAGDQLKKWYDYMKIIFDDVKNDQIDMEKLNQHIKAFEKEDPITKNLCEFIINICDNTSPSKSLIQNTCNEQINIHSVTTDICHKEEKSIADESKKLDQKLSEELAKRKDVAEIQTIQNNLNELNQQKIDPKDQNLLEYARKINEAKTILLNQLQRIPEKNPTPLKRTSTLPDLKPSGKPAVAIVSSNPVQIDQVASTVPPTKQKEIDDAVSKVNNAVQNLVNASKTTNNPRINKVLQEVNTNNQIYNQQSKINPEVARENWVRSVSQTLVTNGQVTDPIIQKFATPVIPSPVIQQPTICLGQNTLLEELDGLIKTINDDEDKKLLTEIRDEYIKLVTNKISKIKEKYISPNSYKN